MDDLQPHWVIFPIHITVDEGPPLGSGWFGTVYRGVWEGANVAVKRLVEETSDQVGCLGAQPLMCCLSFYEF
jgi:hypothetical protein